MRKAILVVLVLLLAAVPASSEAEGAHVRVSKSESVVIQLAPDGSISTKLARVTLRLLSSKGVSRISLADYALGIDPTTLSFSSETPRPSSIETYGPLAVMVWRELTVSEDPTVIEYTADYVWPTPISISHELLVNGKPVSGNSVEVNVSDSVVWRLTVAAKSRKLPGKPTSVPTVNASAPLNVGGGELESVDVPTAVTVSLPLDREHLTYVDISPEPNTTAVIGGVETATWLLHLWGDESVTIEVSARVRAFAEWGIIAPSSFTVIVRGEYEPVASQLRLMAAQLESQADAALELGEALGEMAGSLANLSLAVGKLGAGGTEVAEALRSVAAALGSASSSLESALSDVNAALEAVLALPIPDEEKYAITSYLESAATKVAGSAIALSNATATLTALADSLEAGALKASQLEGALAELADALGSTADSLKDEAGELRNSSAELRMGELAASFASRPILGPVAVGRAGSPPLPASASPDYVVLDTVPASFVLLAARAEAPEGVELAVSHVALIVSGAVENISLSVEDGGAWFDVKPSEYCGLYWDAERGFLAIPVSANVSGRANVLADWLGRPMNVVLSGSGISVEVVVVASASVEGVEVSTSSEVSFSLSQPKLATEFEMPELPPPPPPAERPFPWLELLVALSVALAAAVAVLAARRGPPKPAAPPGPAPSPDELLRKVRKLEERLAE